MDMSRRHHAPARLIGAAVLALALGGAGSGSAVAAQATAGTDNDVQRRPPARDPGSELQAAGRNSAAEQRQRHYQPGPRESREERLREHGARARRSNDGAAGEDVMMDRAGERRQSDRQEHREAKEPGDGGEAARQPDPDGRGGS